MYYYKDILRNVEILITSWSNEAYYTTVFFAYNGVGSLSAIVDRDGNFEWDSKKFNLSDFCEV